MRVFSEVLSHVLRDHCAHSVFLKIYMRLIDEIQLAETSYTLSPKIRHFKCFHYSCLCSLPSMFFGFFYDLFILTTSDVSAVWRS